MSLGPPIRPPQPEVIEWWPVPGKPHLLVNARGQLRTNLPDPSTGRRPVPIDNPEKTP